MNTLYVLLPLLFFMVFMLALGIWGGSRTDRSCSR